MKQKVPESGVLNACLGLLAAERIWHERRNNVPVMVPKKGGGMRPVKVAQNGTGDIFATPVLNCIEGGLRYEHEIVPLWVECKSDSGKQSQAQKDFEKQVKAAGHQYIVVRSSDELKRWLIDHGAMGEK